MDAGLVLERTLGDQTSIIPDLDSLVFQSQAQREGFIGRRGLASFVAHAIVCQPDRCEIALPYRFDQNRSRPLRDQKELRQAIPKKPFNRHGTNAPGKDSKSEPIAESKQILGSIEARNVQAMIIVYAIPSALFHHSVTRCERTSRDGRNLGDKMKVNFDYVIVGAGSAGCVLAARLSEDPDVTVALVEASGRDIGPGIGLPVDGPETDFDTDL